MRWAHPAIDAGKDSKRRPEERREGLRRLAKDTLSLPRLPTSEAATAGQHKQLADEFSEAHLRCLRVVGLGGAGRVDSARTTGLEKEPMPSTATRWERARISPNSHFGVPVA